MRSEANLQRFERYSEWPLAASAFVFLASFSVEVLLEPHGATRHLLRVIDWSIWGIFILDYLVRLYLTPTRWRWFIQHLLDFVIVTLPMLRPLRLLRLLILIELMQRAVGNAFRGRIVVYAVSGVLLLIYTSALAVFDKERYLPGTKIDSFGIAIWWAITTVTTVGYGDVYPITNAGRVIAVLLMIGGIGLVGVVTAALASWVIQRVAEEETALQTATVRHIEDLRTEIRELGRELHGEASSDQDGTR